METPSEDGSFVWTDASNSYSSDDMAMDTGGNSGGEESEYGKTYKKKLHKELFTNGNGDVKHERDNKHKKRKRKKDSSDSEHSDVTRKKIKVEPKSDHDLSGDVLSNIYDEHLLDEKVKKEQEFLLPTEKVKKKKRSKTNSNENVDLDIKLDTDEPEEQPSNDSNTEDSLSRLNYNTKDNVSKKKKKKSEKREAQSNVLEEHENHTNSPEKYQNRTSSKSRQKDKVQKEKHSVSDETDVRNHTVDTTIADVDISEISKISIVNMSQDESLTVNSNTGRRQLVSERIQFEDDIMETEPNHVALRSGSKPVKKQSDKLKRFIEANNKLKVCPIENYNELRIESSEEVWVVTCPGDVDVSAFRGRSVQLDGRCKVKLGGAVYEGNATRADGWGALMAPGALQAARLAGRLALYRRPPRAAPPPIELAGAPLVGRVSLPATKRRHPLLGAHYKKALKLPPAVAERLRACATSASAPAPRASRKRRRGSDPPPAPAPTPASPSTPAPSKKKAKKKRHNLEAAETWASERAIEESLFDF